MQHPNHNTIEYSQCPYCRGFHSPYDMCEPELLALEADFRDRFERYLERRARGVAYGDHGRAGPLRPGEQWFAPVETAGNMARARVGTLHDSGTVRRYFAGAGEATVATWQERRSPAREANLSADVLTPLAQAVVTGLLAALAGGLGFASIWKYFLSGSWPAAGDTVAAAATVGFAAVAVLWIALLGDHRRSLWHVETLEQTPAGAPQPTPEPANTPRVRLEVREDRSNGTQRTVYGDLPIEPEKLTQAAKRIRRGDAFSESSLTGSGAPLSRRQFRELRDWMIKRNLAHWRDPDNKRLGIEFTGAGRQMWQRLADGGEG